MGRGGRGGGSESPNALSELADKQDMVTLRGFSSWLGPLFFTRSSILNTHISPGHPWGGGVVGGWSPRSREKTSPCGSADIGEDECASLSFNFSMQFARLSAPWHEF